MKLVVGLGNPGKKYELTRHNAGFLIVDRLAGKFAKTGFQHKQQVLLAEAIINGEKLLLVKPQTFMNVSGQGVVPLVNFYKIELADLLVIYDDLDLETGKIRLRPQGGPGGHNGIKSIIEMLGTEDFPRLKIGIGRPPQGWEAADYVLSRFSDEEWPVINEVFNKAEAVVQSLVTEGIERAMSNHN